MPATRLTWLETMQSLTTTQRKVTVMDRCMFIAQEIGCAQVDDFCNLPYEPVYRNVVQSVGAAYERHAALFNLTH